MCRTKRAGIVQEDQWACWEALPLVPLQGDTHIFFWAVVNYVAFRQQKNVVKEVEDLRCWLQ